MVDTTAVIRTPNLPPVTTVAELLAHSTVGGKLTLGRIAFDLLVNLIRDEVSGDPSGVATLQQALQAEIQRAEGAEGVLTTNLAAEIARAVLAEISGLATRRTKLFPTDSPTLAAAMLDASGRAVWGVRKDGWLDEINSLRRTRQMTHPLYSRVTVDAAGQIISCIYNDGSEFPRRDPGLVMMATTVSGSTRQRVAVSDGTTERLITLDTAGDDLPGDVPNGKAVWTNSNGGVRSPRQAWVDRRSTMLASVTDLVILIGYGQSLMMGAPNTLPPVTGIAPVPGRLLGYNRGPRALQVRPVQVSLGGNVPAQDMARLREIADLRETLALYGQDSETPMTRAGMGLLASLPATTAVFGLTAAIGSSSIAQLAQGTQPYLNLLTQVRDLVVWARMQGLASVKVAPILWKQGENNASTAYADYLPLLTALQSALEADLLAITGQGGSIPFLSSQLTANPTNDGIVSGPALAIYDASVSSPTKFACISPDFRFQHIDGTHLYPLGYGQLGEGFGRALATIYGGGTWTPPHLISAVRSGQTITAKFDRTVAVDPNITDPGLGGFGLTGAGSGVAISGVAAPNGANVAITITGTPSSGAKLTLGRQPRDGLGSGPSTGPRHVYLDPTDTFASAIDGSALPGRPVLQEITITT